MDIYFILWVIIQYYDLFCCTNCLSLTLAAFNLLFIFGFLAAWL